MNRIRAALPWRKKTYYGDSDSTGYCSSSDVSKALSDSQFILRPNTALLSSSYSNGTNYYALDYTENSRKRDKGSTITSRSSTISSTTFKSHSMNLPADDEGSGELEDDEASTIRANSVRQVPMMPKLTSIKHLMTTSSDASSSSEVLQEEIEDDTATLEEVSTMEYSDEDDDITLDIVPRRKEYRNSSFRSFPFSYQLMESEMDRLFDMMQVDEQLPSTSSTSNHSGSCSNRKKRLLIREPTSTIYYHDISSSEAPPPPPRPSLARTESVPRSILKNNTSSFAIYEEIYGDHLTPPPTDIRPQLPDRPIMAFQQFPPCTTFQPRLPQRLPSVRRRKKMPSLHHSTSFASYFRRKK
ncbi:hypothetical protein CAEBREN_12208 [Caenorhabditis brenneri]|uniref:Uncharacterized protein n=1 Tax=Caenorhabditis brenneri TaxID=135651 RepID=G0PB32_CAEBE|nr:hypothetical protein CAEBREN_12208 [Caenorhabditis brenneri]